MEDIITTYPFKGSDKKPSRGGFLSKKENNGKWPVKKKIITVISAILIIFVILGLLSIDNVKEAYAKANSAKEHLNLLQEAIGKQDLINADKELKSAKQDLEDAQKELNGVKWAIIVPYVGTQVNYANKLVSNGVELLGGLSDTVSAGKEVLSPFQSKEIVNFSQLSDEQKGQALELLSTSAGTFENSLNTVKKVDTNIAELNDFGVNSKLKEVKKLLVENIPTAEKFLNELVLASKILPKIGGHPNEQTYFFIFENNTELRASGGFIGSVGILNIYQGQIKEFTTSGVYDLDKQSDHQTEPPDFLRRYLSASNWFMRDANVISPDFPTSAKKVLEFYKIETGEENFDGVIAITPTFLEYLLEITGPVKVPGYPYTFTKDNFTTTLQDHVERNYENLGISKDNRKAIISDLSKVLIDKVFELPKEKWGDLVETLQNAFSEKQAMIYMKDKEAQKTLSEYKWTAEVDKDWQNDYLLVADNNMAALKTDRVMDREINYEIDASNPDNIKAKVSITYVNNGSFTMYTTRYRTYSELFVPKDAELISSSGAELGDGENQETEVGIKDDADLHKKVFTYFKSIEPGAQETITIEYKIPKNIFDGKLYKLLVQKQPGTIQHKLKVKVTLPHKIIEYSPEYDDVILDNNMTSFTTDLKFDRQFEAKTK